MSTALEQLKAEIDTRNVLIVVGAGVSVGATAGSPFASWRGLLTNGVDFCTDLNLASASEWKDWTNSQIEKGDIADMISAAQNVADRLGAPKGGNFRRWLRESVGSLIVHDDATLRAIVDLDLPIATTNYDSLLSSVSSLPPVVWTNTTEAQRWSRGDHRGVLHLHGHWESPESVVLGVRSYDDILRDEATQTLLRNFVYTHTLLFVGFGSGLADPNFSALLRWSERVLAGSEYNHFRLVLNSNLDAANAEHKGDHVRVVGIGESYGDLPSFLRSLCSTHTPTSDSLLPGETEVQRLTRGRAELFQRKALLDEEKATTPTDEYTEKLADIAENLARIGGTRSAVRMLFSHISQSYNILSFNIRTSKGLLLVELLLGVGDYKFAMDMLRTLFNDCTSQIASVEIAEKFWVLSASASGSQFAYDDAAASFAKAIENCSDSERRAAIAAERDEFNFLRGVMPREAAREEAN